MIEKQIHPEESNECRSFHRFYQEDKVDILCLNTAITCYGQEKEGELFLDSESVRKIISNTGIQRPLIILAHHDLKFLTPVEMENLKFMIRNRSVFYLCGHSHKLEYGYDDESKYAGLWLVQQNMQKEPILLFPWVIFLTGETRLVLHFINIISPIKQDGIYTMNLVIELIKQDRFYRKQHS